MESGLLQNEFEEEFNQLRTVPTIVSAYVLNKLPIVSVHMFCVSRDARISCYG